MKDMEKWAAIKVITDTLNAKSEIQTINSKTTIRFFPFVVKENGFTPEEYQAITGRTLPYGLNGGSVHVERKGKVHRIHDYGSPNRGPADFGPITEVPSKTPALQFEMKDSPSGGPHYDPNYEFWPAYEAIKGKAVDELVAALQA